MPKDDVSLLDETGRAADIGAVPAGPFEFAGGVEAEPTGIAVVLLEGRGSEAEALELR